jgi:NAD(P)-dependent dehydrogenase (short-subunit alcohol dehydrogenase family)
VLEVRMGNHNVSLQLEGKAAIVTGGGSGIGQYIALEFAKSGANVAVASRRLPLLQKTASEIRARGRQSLAIEADITKKTQIQNMIRQVRREFGHIDILVNNSGVNTDYHLLDLPLNEWHRIINTNLMGYFLCCQAVGKTMVQQKSGNIINISSNAALSSGGLSSVYHISKAGINLLTRCLAWELGSHNIRINEIAPGFTRDTGMSEQQSGDPDVLERIASRRPIGRVSTPEEIARIAVFLASEASSSITGQTIIADGGLSA